MKKYIIALGLFCMVPQYGFSIKGLEDALVYTYPADEEKGRSDKHDSAEYVNDEVCDRAKCTLNRKTVLCVSFCALGSLVVTGVLYQYYSSQI